MMYAVVCYTCEFRSVRQWFNFVVNDKTLNSSTWRALNFEGKKLKVAQMMKFVLDGVVNTVGKGENAGYQHFLLFSTMFSNLFSVRVIKARDCVVKSE